MVLKIGKPLCNNTQLNKKIMTETKEQELKPCPFCGSTHIVVADAHQPKDAAMCFRCDDCSASIDIKKPATMKQAIAAWNRRVETPTPQWSQEPPTTVGWFCVIVDPANPELAEPGLVKIFKDANVLCLRHWDEPSMELAWFTENYPNAQWCRIDTPEPPLPTEGRAE